MDWVQFKVPVSHTHLACARAVVACWCLTQEVAGWQGFEPLYCNDKYFATEFSEFSENILEKLHWCNEIKLDS